MKYLVIANPKAGTRALGGTLEQVRRAFETRKIAHEVRFTQFPGHAAKIAAEGLFSEMDGEVGAVAAVGEKLLLFGASNGPFQGGKFKLAPRADIFDGYLDIHIISDMNPLGRLFKIQKVLEGRHEGLREVSIVRTKKLWFETFTDLPAHMDGETFLLQAGKHSIRIGERGVNIIVPV